MPKQGNGEGSIYPHKRNGKKVGYRGAYTVYTSSGPKRRYVTGKTREEARQQLIRAMADRDGGLVFEDGGLTVGEYIERWLKDSVRGTVRQSTHDTYIYMTYPHIVPVLGRVKLKALTPVHVRNFYREKLDGSLTSATVRKIHGVLQKASIKRSPMALYRATLPRASGCPRARKRRAGRYPPMNEVRTLLHAARGDRLEALYVLAIYTGLREGELLDLRWKDVDLEGAVLRVSQTLTRDGGMVSVGPPKTKNSQRSVGLTEGAVEALRDHLAQQHEEMERLGSLYRSGGLVFANELGGIVDPSNLRNRSLKALLDRASLPPIRFHDLRHTCATLLLSRNGNP